MVAKLTKKENKNEKIRVQTQEDAHEAFLIYDEFSIWGEEEQAYIDKIKIKVPKGAVFASTNQKRTGVSK